MRGRQSRTLEFVCKERESAFLVMFWSDVFWLCGSKFDSYECTADEYSSDDATGASDGANVAKKAVVVVAATTVMNPRKSSAVVVVAGTKSLAVAEDAVAERATLTESPTSTSTPAILGDERKTRTGSKLTHCAHVDKFARGQWLSRYLMATKRELTCAASDKEGAYASSTPVRGIEEVKVSGREFAVHTKRGKVLRFRAATEVRLPTPCIPLHCNARHVPCRRMLRRGKPTLCARSLHSPRCWRRFPPATNLIRMGK